MSIASPGPGDTRLVRPSLYYTETVDGIINTRIGPPPDWRVSSSTVQQLPATGHIDFYVPVPVIGVVVGLGGDPTSYYPGLTHGLFFSKGLVQPIELGVLKSSSASYLDSDQFTINLTGTTVTYKKNGTTFYTSAAALSGTAHRPYAFLYAPGDAVWDLTITSTVSSGTGSGIAMLAPLKAIGAAPARVGIGHATLNYLAVESITSEIVVPVNALVADFKPMRVSGVGPTNAATLYATLKPLNAVGSSATKFGFGYATLMPLSADGVSGSLTYQSIFSGLGGASIFNSLYGLHLSIIGELGAHMISAAVIKLPQSIMSSLSMADRTRLLQILLSIISGMGLHPTFAPQLRLLESILGGLSMADRTAILAALQAAIISQLGISAGSGLGLANVPNETWVVNTEKSIPQKQGAVPKNISSRYDNYDFNSMMVFRGVAYGARADGVYLLQGDDDAGAPIRSSLNFGKTNFGTPVLKSLSAAYVNTESGGRLFMRVTQNGQEFIYKSRAFADELMAQRFDFSRGLRANYFSFELYNGPGASMELDSVEFVQVPLSRRIS